MRPSMKILVCTLALGMLGGPLAGLSMAADKYYAIFFASQSEPRRARFSHTFCTFMKAEEGNADVAAEPKLETHTISWLPTSGVVRVLALRPERGRNFSLDETLRVVRSTGQHVRSYGPYEVSADTYNKLLRQKQKLDSGRYTYKAIDGRVAGALNCIHAVTTADPAWGGFGVPSQSYGFPSVSILAERVTNKGQVLAQNQDWILEKLAIRTGRGIRYMNYDPERQQHLARVPADPNQPILSQNPATKTVR